MNIILRLLTFCLCFVVALSTQSKTLFPSDPFHTNALTSSQPSLVWQNKNEITVDTSASNNALSQLPNTSLSLREITDFALRNNPNTKLAWAKAKIAAAELGIEKSAYLPQIATGGAYTYTADVFANESNSESTLEPNISLSYVVWDFGMRKNSVKSARYNTIAASLLQNDEIQQVILQVEQAYYQLLGQRALVDANKQNLAEAQKSFMISQTLRKHGLATIGDVYQAESAATQAQLNLEQAQGNEQISLGQLATTMGLPANYPLKIQGLSSSLGIHKINREVNYFLETSKKYRPDLLAAEAKVRASQANLAATKSSSLPVIAINASAGSHVVGNTSLTGTTSSISVSIPLFTGFQQSYAVRRAKSQLLADQASRDLLNQQVEMEVWQAYYQLQTAEKSIMDTDRLLRSAKQSTLQATGQYKAGVGNILSVLSTQTSLANARSQSIQARLNWYTALAALAAAAGTLNS